MRAYYDDTTLHCVIVTKNRKAVSIISTTNMGAVSRASFSPGVHKESSKVSGTHSKSPRTDKGQLLCQELRPMSPLSSQFPFLVRFSKKEAAHSEQWQLYTMRVAGIIYVEGEKTKLIIITTADLMMAKQDVMMTRRKLIEAIWRTEKCWQANCYLTFRTLKMKIMLLLPGSRM